MAQPPSHPTLINLPPPGSNPETPSEMPGTPTSTTTSLSTLSTTAIKDGHRGHFALGRGHQHSPSTTSLEAERADRISRLAGLERVSTLRAAPPSLPSPQTTPTSAAMGFLPGFPASQHLTPAYFDSNGQPVAVTKMSTVGSASATESHVGTTPGERDEDMLSTGTNFRGAGSVASAGPDPDPMDEDMAERSVGAYDDRISDDGSASLVGFGEGAGSTLSGPIYHRRAPPGTHPPAGLERSASARGRDTPMSAAALQERRDARMVDGVAAEPPHPAFPPADDTFVDTTFRGPVPPARQQNRETAESIVQQLDRGEQTAGPSALGSPGRGGEPLGRFYFEGDNNKDD